MPSITPVMSAIRRDAAVMPAMVCSTWPAILPPTAAAAWASLARSSARTLASALACTVVVSSSMVAAVSSSDAACNSVRRARSDIAAGNFARVVEHAGDLRAHVVDDGREIRLQLVQRLQHVAEVVVARDLQIGGQIAGGETGREARHVVDRRGELARQHSPRHDADRRGDAERNPERRGRRALPCGEAGQQQRQRRERVAGRRARRDRQTHQRLQTSAQAGAHHHAAAQHQAARLARAHARIQRFGGAHRVALPASRAR